MAALRAHVDQIVNHLNNDKPFDAICLLADERFQWDDVAAGVRRAFGFEWGALVVEMPQSALRVLVEPHRGDKLIVSHKHHVADLERLSAILDSHNHTLLSDMIALGVAPIAAMVEHVMHNTLTARDATRLVLAIKAVAGSTIALRIGPIRTFMEACAREYHDHLHHHRDSCVLFRSYTRFHSLWEACGCISTLAMDATQAIVLYATHEWWSDARAMEFVASADDCAAVRDAMQVLQRAGKDVQPYVLDTVRLIEESLVAVGTTRLRGRRSAVYQRALVQPSVPPIPEAFEGDEGDAKPISPVSSPASSPSPVARNQEPMQSQVMPGYTLAAEEPRASAIGNVEGDSQADTDEDA